MTGNTGSNTLYLSAKAVYDWVIGLGYITSSALTGYATQAWVTAQGYITNVITALGYTPANQTTTISTSSPLSGGGDLSANRTISISQATTSTDGYLSSTDWNTFNGKQTALGYTPVPDTRTITINGTSYDLSANRTWTVSSSAQLSQLLAAAANNTIANTTYNQEWQWSNPTGTAFKLSTSSTSAVNNSVLFELSSTGANSNVTTYGQKITANRTGTNVVNYGLDITHAGVNGAGLNISTNGVGINLAASMTGGIQMNSNKLAFDASSVGTIQYASSILQISSNASRTFFINTGTSNSWNFASSTTANYLTFNRIASGSYGVVFNGDYASGSYRSELTSNNVIKANGGSLTFCGNTGVSSGFANFTPTDIMTVYGTNSNVGIGTTTPNSSAALDVTSTTKGLLFPRMTVTQRNAIVSPVAGLAIYNTTNNVLQVYDGSTWQSAW